MSIRKRLQRAVAASGMTRYAVAKAASVDYDALCRLLDDDRRDTRLSTIQRLADYFGLTLDDATKPQLV